MYSSLPGRVRPQSINRYHTIHWRERNEIIIHEAQKNYIRRQISVLLLILSLLLYLMLLFLTSQTHLPRVTSRVWSPAPEMRFAINHCNLDEEIHMGIRGSHTIPEGGGEKSGGTAGGHLTLDILAFFWFFSLFLFPFLLPPPYFHSLYYLFFSSFPYSLLWQ